MNTLKQLTLILGAAAFLFIGCSTFDDTQINSRVDDLENRITELERLVNELTSNLGTLVTAIDALENQDRIVSVNKLPGDAGWEIVFANSGTVTIYNGANGKDGDSPVIGVQKDTDGIYYWTLNGEFLLDGNNQKIPATAQYGMPQIKIEDGKFWFSTDGEKWIECGDVASEGIGTIKGVEDKGDSVVFTLYDDSTITIPKVQSFALNIENTEVGIAAGETAQIPYTITAADDATKITAIPVAGYSVSVTKTSSSEGTLNITAPDPVVDADIYVVAVNGDGVTSGKILSFAAGQLEVVYDAQTVPAKGGNVSVTVNTNLEYDVVIPEEDRAWISLVPDSKALRQDVLTFSVSENTETSQRSSTISINYKSGDPAKTFVIVQDAASGEVVEEWQEANLAAFNEDGWLTQFGSRTTIDGWSIENAKIQNPNQMGWAGQTVDIQLAGNMNSPGKLSSPVIDGGCGVLSITFGCLLKTQLPNGISLNMKILSPSDEELFNTDITVPNAELETMRALREREIEVNVSGTFKMIVTNNCPAQKATVANDNTEIFRIAWKPYSE